ncbi:choice-of-anchor M domain-containing protein [Nocardioides sp. SYSU D00038]|uniref:choice-of-anchor M domain-containing protein n=1 Tax=Nocardioides sp. SYSU D00038 TaxID=2812554 RepID=UPI00196768CE|nr:choice-of-anchor M domain-containing protein [Nocardioides sp. SYSU D00038]
MKNPLRLLVAAALATGALVAGTSPAVQAAQAERPFVLDDGHIDLFDVVYDPGASGLRLQVRDDTGLYAPGPVTRAPEDVTVQADAEAAEFVTPSTPPAACGCPFFGEQGTVTWVLPFTQEAGLPWAGWSTERLKPSLPQGTTLPESGTPVEIELDIDGPGDVHLYQWSAFGSVTNHQVDTTSAAPDVIKVGVNQHVHGEWLFTEQGSYSITATPRATTTGGQTLTGPPASYHVQIGAEEPTLDLAVTPNRAGAEYLYGQGITLTAAPSEATELDHYHWFVKRAGESEFSVSERSTTQELKLPTSMVWDGAQVYASLYDDEHRVVASSQPLTLSVETLPPVTTLTAAADKASYTVGETVQLSSTQQPPTGEDHFHWYVRKPGEEFFTYIPGSDAASATLPVTAEHDGAEVAVRLFDHDHAVIAESAPLTLDVRDPAPAATTTAVRLSRATQSYGATGPVRATATVAGEGVTGTVTFRSGARVLASGVGVSAQGTATATLPRDLPAGRHQVVASFVPGATSLGASTSPPVVLRVTKAATRTRATAPRRVRAGARATVRVVVGAPLPASGKVVVRKSGRVVGTARLDARGRAGVRLSRLRPGLHRLVVAYPGGANHRSSRAAVTIRVVR